MENITRNNNYSINYSHIPVLLHEAIDGLAIQPNSWYIDATLGGGGYATALLRAQAKVLGIDADIDAVTYVKERLKEELPDRQENSDWIIVHDNFQHLSDIAKQFGKEIQGIVFDLGVSSYQLDTKEKGFSYRFADAPLDLRLDQTQGTTAAEVITTYSKEELYEVFTRYGEEKRSGAIADRIISTRRLTPIETTGDLKRVIGEAVSEFEQKEASARIFQALRIAVNDELEHLKRALESAKEIIKPGGRVCVVSFHSLEDRIVKQQFRREGWTIITKNPIVPSEEEIQRNRRSRSAKLRIAQKQII